MWLLDTNILSQLTKPRPDPGVVDQLRQCRSDTVFGSAVSRYELRNAARVEVEILPVVTWLPVTQSHAEYGAVIAADLRRKGRSCGDFDPLLAATALEYGLILVTRNVRHFEPIDELSLENWFHDA